MEALGKNGVQNKIVSYPNSCYIDACYNEVDLYLAKTKNHKIPLPLYIRLEYKSTYGLNIITNIFRMYLKFKSKSRSL